MLDVTAEVLDVGNAGAERDAVHDEEIGLGPDLLDLFPHVPLVLAGGVGPLGADGGVHRMIAGAAVDGRPGELHLNDPLREVAAAAGVAKEVALLVLLGPSVVEAVPAGVETAEIAFLHFISV